MPYFLAKESALKWLETPSVYHIKKDELYELDNEAFRFLKNCGLENGCSAKESGFTDYCVSEGILTTEPPNNKLQDANSNKVIASPDKIGAKQSQDRLGTGSAISKQRLPRGVYPDENGARNDKRRPSVIKAPVPSLRYLELQITDRCNLRCKHCYIDTNSTSKLSLRGVPIISGRRSNLKKEIATPIWLAMTDKEIAGGKVKASELSINRIKTILTEFEEMQGLRVLITGGEPLLHSRFKEINEILPQFFIRKILFTNGLLLNKKVLKNLNVDEIQISIDGLEKAHESLRGKGTFKKALEAVKSAIDTGFEVSISTMVHPLNLGDFDDMEALFKGLGIKDWTVDVPCISGRLEKHAEFQITPEEGGKYLGDGYGDGLHSGALGFACGLHLMSVMADGRTAKCTFYADRNAGNIKGGLRECRQKIKPIRLSKLKCDCEHIEICRGGCRYRAEMLGDPMGKDLYRCALYKETIF